MTAILLRISFLVFIFLVLANVSKAQTNQPQNEPYDSPDSPIKCAEWLNYLADALGRWEKNKDASFIVIARLGDGETSRRLNLKRIKVLRDYILDSDLKVKAVFAEGERIKGFGVVEIYVQGKLLYSLPIRQKNDMTIGFCP